MIDILVKILAYICVVILSQISNLAILVFLPIGMLLKHIRIIRLLYILITTVIVGIITVWLVTIVCGWFAVTPTYLMFLIIFYMTWNNGQKRIKMAQDRESREIEWTMFIGDYIGLSIGLFLFLKKASFI